ncbi:hypothetical protein [Methylomonas sp. AM2-LC]|uniref:hypothetical protein n=1 Tax=Methylomonas sp. AM2-LC TaxID=3153301 RepID=UPI003264FB5D
MNEHKALTDVYSSLLGTGDTSASDFLNATTEELKDAILEHFKPKHMEDLFKEAFIRGINYALFQQKHKDTLMTEEDFFGEDGLITKHIDWDEAMLDW